MALFELDGGQLVPAQFGKDVPAGFSPEVLDAVRAQVLEIISRPLFPVTWRDIGRNHEKYAEPRLTAIDASGQVVSVEVVDHLNADFLIDALSRLADTAHMSWMDLANEYPSHVEGFKRGWMQFRESMPVSPPNGPRLIVVAAYVSDEVRPALDVLSTSGIEVHEMSLRQMSNGRMFLDIGVVGPRLYGHSANYMVTDGALAANSLEDRADKQIKGAVAPTVIPATVMPEADVMEHRSKTDPEPPSKRRQSPFPSRLDRHRADTGRIPVARTYSQDSQGLAALAAVNGRPVGLEYTFAGHDGRVAKATLTGSGQIENVTGTYDDPTKALEALGVRGVDGWDAWHLGDRFGPTLSEALSEVNQSGR